MKKHVRSPWSLVVLPLLVLGVGSWAAPDEAAAGPAARQLTEVRLQTGEGQTTMAVRIGSFTRVGARSAGMFGFLIRSHDSGAYRVDLFRVMASGDAQTTSPKDFQLADSFLLAGNASTSRPLPGGGTFEVSIPGSAAADLDIGEDDTAGCCVYCDNGVEICGTKVRSSCGNCG